MKHTKHVEDIEYVNILPDEYIKNSYLMSKKDNLIKKNHSHDRLLAERNPRQQINVGKALCQVHE